MTIRTSAVAGSQTGSGLLVKGLEARGVQYVFDIPGAKIDKVFDTLLDSKIKPVVCLHEQNAAFIASGIGRMTSKARGRAGHFRRGSPAFLPSTSRRRCFALTLEQITVAFLSPGSNYRVQSVKQSPTPIVRTHNQDTTCEASYEL